MIRLMLVVLTPLLGVAGAWCPSVAMAAPGARSAPGPVGGLAGLSADALKVIDLIGAGGASHPIPGVRWGSHTEARVQALWLWKSLPADEQSRLRPVLKAPLAGTCVSSEHLPIEVCYLAPHEREPALNILELAEDAWVQEVDELGFMPPRRPGTGRPEEGSRIFIRDTSDVGEEVGGYAAPVDVDPSLNHTGCYSYIVIDDEVAFNEAVATVVRHEFNHTCQQVMDCLETMTSAEATATWVESAIFGQSDFLFQIVVPEFQKYPERSIAWAEYLNIYHYGAALFVLFIQEFLCDGDPRCIVTLWENTMQSGYVNEPDLFDALILLAEERDVSIDTLLVGFGEWRFMVGVYDDGEHFESGALWVGAEPSVRVSESLHFGDTRALDATFEIQPLGYGYGRLVVRDAPVGPSPASGESQPIDGHLVVTLTTHDRVDIRAELWLMRQNRILSRWAAPIEPVGGDGALAIERQVTAPLTDVQQADEVILMIANIGHDIDWDQTWNSQSIHARIEQVITLDVTEVTPAQVPIGASRNLLLSGQGFVPDTRVELSNDAVSVVAMVIEDPAHIELQVQVDPMAEPAPVDLIIRREHASSPQAVILEEAFEIVVPGPPEVDSVLPDHSAPGETLMVRVRGRGFLEGVSLSLACDGVEITETTRIDSESVYLAVVIDASAAAANCDLHITDRFEQTTVVERAFEVEGVEETRMPVDAGVDADAVDDEEGATDSGCGCTLSGGPPVDGMVLMGLSSLLWLARRRRGRPTPGHR